MGNIVQRMDIEMACILFITEIVITAQAASVVYWSEVLARDPEFLGSIPGATREYK
jgi:hypothetical protein